MIKSKIQHSIVITLLLFSGATFAVTEATTTTTTTNVATAPEAVKPIEDPIVMLKRVTDNVLHALKANGINSGSRPDKIYPVIDKDILPYVDFNEMSTWVAGRTAWHKASEKNRADFIAAFKVLVVRTYGTALSNYTNEVVEFPSQHIDTKKERIQVTSQIKRANKESIRVDYRLIKQENSWLVYDIIIEGVSILQGFQAQFSEEIRQQGLAYVTARIKEHNSKSEVST